MKKVLLVLLALMLVIPTVLGITTVGSAAEATETRPFYVFTNWVGDFTSYSNVYSRISVAVNVKKADDGSITATVGGDNAASATAVYNQFKKRPEGARWLTIEMDTALAAVSEDVIYFDAGIEPISNAIEAFLTAYKNLGGKLDGLYTKQDLAHSAGSNGLGYWWINSHHYQHGRGDGNSATYNPNIYADMVENPLYAESVRPLLEERGFVFYPEDVDHPEYSEIYGIYPWVNNNTSTTVYKNNNWIWNLVMECRMAEYMNQMVYEPMLTVYPDAQMADYRSNAIDGWQKDVNLEASAWYVGGSTVHAGTMSGYNTDSTLYSMNVKQWPGVNRAFYGDRPFTQTLWDVNVFKYSSEATDGNRMAAWVDDHRYKSQGLVAEPYYYTELLYHLGLANVDAFFGSMYNDKQQHVYLDEIMTQLTALVGDANRKPVDYPMGWNYNFILSGMTAGGKSYWRITPDTKYVSRSEFKVSGKKDPTFTVNGQTVTFPGGKVLEEPAITTINSCGYWVEMAENAVPVINGIADRYTAAPAYCETFDAELNASYWTQEGTRLTVADGKLVVKGATNVENVNLPQRVTAGDTLALEQEWRLTVTIPAGLNEEAVMKFLYCNTKDGGFKIEGGKLWYDENGSYRELMDVDYTAGGTFQLIRQVDMTVPSLYKSSYFVYDGEGKLLDKAEEVKMLDVKLPYTGIGMSWSRVKTEAYVDDYALNARGHSTAFTVYEVGTGLPLDTVQTANKNLGYRMTWLNATDKTEKAEIIAAHYDASGNLVEEEVLETIEMNPGTDGVVTGAVKKKASTLRVYLKEYDRAHVVTLNNVGKGASGAGKFHAGETVTVDAGTRPGFTFVGWTSGSGVTFADTTRQQTTFTMVDNAVTVSAKWEVTVVEGVKPFYLLNWSGVEEGLFANVDAPLYFSCTEVRDGVPIIKYNNIYDIKELAQMVKAEFDSRPEGMRWINFAPPSSYVLKSSAKDVLFMEEGVAQLKAWVDEFLAEYKAIGGKIDGLMLDFEYFDAEYWFLYTKHYTQNMRIYLNIANNPVYTEKLRPMLEERGFKFYDNVTEYTPEIFGIYPNAGEEYDGSRRIWDACTRNLISMYLNEAVYEPALKHFPNISVNDYTTRDMNAWFKEVDEGGGPMYLGGNRIKIGNSSNNNTYSYAPVITQPAAGGASYQYSMVPGYNKTAYEDDPYNMAMWDVNLCKYMYSSTPEKEITMWFAFYYYNEERPGSTSHSPYYAEAIIHMGLLDPDPFFGFIVPGHNDRLTTGEEYNNAIQVSSDILTELTRIVGAEDRKPIETPANWNNGYLLSGMYAGGKNYWRITPDTTDGMTLEAFLISKDGEDPTFSINGQTITFPGGKIIEDGEISEIGTCGYWVETPAEMTMPTVTNIPNRYEAYPSFREHFDSYITGTKFNSDMSLLPKVWEVWALNESLCEIVEDPTNTNSQMLALNGLVSLKNVYMPGNLTAGDSYAKQQMWEVSFILPEGINDGAEIRLFNIFSAGSNDDCGLKIQDGKVFYDQAGTYVELTGVTLETGKKYTAKRELDFRVTDGHLSSYYVYDSEGNLIGEAKNVPMVKKIALPIDGIGLSCNNVIGDPVLLDDYKLYPVGLTAEFEVYNADTGILLSDQTSLQDGDGAYRLSWLNGSDTAVTKVVVAAYYDANGNLVEEKVIKTVEMLPGWDGVETDIVENPTEGQTLKLYMQNADSNDCGGIGGGDDAESLGLILGIAGGAVVLIAAVVVVLILIKKKPTAPAAE